MGRGLPQLAPDREGRTDGADDGPRGAVVPRRRTLLVGLLGWNHQACASFQVRGERARWQIIRSRSGSDAPPSVLLLT